MNHVALTLMVTAAVLFALMFLFDEPRIAAVVVILSGLAWIAHKLSQRR